MKTVEEMVEGNYNSIDGVINNLPTGNDERPSVLQALRELRGNDSEDKERERQREALYEDERQR